MGTTVADRLMGLETAMKMAELGGVIFIGTIVAIIIASLLIRNK